MSVIGCRWTSSFTKSVVVVMIDLHIFHKGNIVSLSECLDTYTTEGVFWVIRAQNIPKFLMQEGQSVVLFTSEKAASEYADRHDLQRTYVEVVNLSVEQVVAKVHNSVKRIIVDPNTEKEKRIPITHNVAA